MGLVISLPVGIVRTVIGVVQKFILRQNKPLRIDLPLPFIPIDVVMVSDPSHILTIAGHSDVERLHGLPTDSLPTWTKWYFAGTRFHNKKNDKWFVAFEPQSEAVRYTERRAAIAEKLSTGFTDDEVKNVADHLMRGETEESIAEIVTQIVNRRFFQGGSSSITPAAVEEARKLLSTNIAEAIIPGKQKTGVQANESTYEFCAAGAQAGLNVMDATHNFGASAGPFSHAVMLLSKNLDTPVETLFTRKANCPTPTIPRVVVNPTNLNGLLSYPGKPKSTILLLSISAAAEASNSLQFTFGSGGQYRPCAFKEFFVTFMTALQNELKSRRQKG